MPPVGRLFIRTNINERKEKSMQKGIDQKFVHYGIRREDLTLIAAICEKNEIDFDWMSESILRAYHGKKVDVIEMSDADTENIIKAAIQKIR